jgi:hypothetical protein
VQLAEKFLPLATRHPIPSLVDPMFTFVYGGGRGLSCFISYAYSKVSMYLVKIESHGGVLLPSSKNDLDVDVSSGNPTIRGLEG